MQVCVLINPWEGILMITKLRFVERAFQHYVFTKSYVSHLPKNFKIEIQPKCNLRCPICTDMTKDRKMTSMSYETFRQLVDQIPENSYIDMYGYGETLLHKDVFPMIRYAKSKNNNIRVSSNLNIDQETVKGIVESGIDTLIISLDGVSQEAYQQYRIRGDIALVLKNIEYLVALKESSGSALRIIWQFIINRYNEHEIKDAQHMATKLGVEISFIPMGLAHDVIDGPYSKETIGDLKKLWLPLNSKYRDSYFAKGPKLNKENTPCPSLWEWMTIYADGSVMPCCKITKSENSFGNIHESSLEEIWNNTQFRTSRDLFIRGNGIGCKTLCALCDKYEMKSNVATIHRCADFMNLMIVNVLKRLRILSFGNKIHFE